MNYPFLLKFSKITNLTEARISSGFFADYISFDCSPKSEFFLEPNKISEIMRWIVGPKLVLCFENEPLEWISDYVSKFNPVLIELPIERYKEDFSNLNIEIIWKTNDFDYFISQKANYFESENIEICELFFKANKLCFFANKKNQNVENLNLGGLTLFGEKEKEVGKAERENWYRILEDF